MDMKGFHANRDCIFGKNHRFQQIDKEMFRDKQCFSSQVSSCRQTSTECRSHSRMQGGAPGTHVLLSCHTGPAIQHSYLSIHFAFVLKHKPEENRFAHILCTRTHQKSHRSKWFRSPPWSRTLTAFGRCSLQALTIHDWLIICMLRSYFLLPENQRSQKDQGSSRTSTQFRYLFCNSPNRQSVSLCMDTSSDWSISAVQTTRFMVEPVHTGCSVHWSQLFLCQQR